MCNNLNYCFETITKSRTIYYQDQGQKEGKDKLVQKEEEGLQAAYEKTKKRVAEGKAEILKNPLISKCLLPRIHLLLVLESELYKFRVILNIGIITEYSSIFLAYLALNCVYTIILKEEQ